MSRSKPSGSSERTSPAARAARAGLVHHRWRSPGDVGEERFAATAQRDHPVAPVFRWRDAGVGVVEASARGVQVGLLQVRARRRRARSRDPRARAPRPRPAGCARRGPHHAGPPRASRCEPRRPRRGVRHPRETPDGARSDARARRRPASSPRARARTRRPSEVATSASLRGPASATSRGRPARTTPQPRRTRSRAMVLRMIVPAMKLPLSVPEILETPTRLL